MPNVLVRLEERLSHQLRAPCMPLHEEGGHVEELGARGVRGAHVVVVEEVALKMRLCVCEEAWGL